MQILGEDLRCAFGMQGMDGDVIVVGDVNELFIEGARSCNKIVILPAIHIFKRTLLPKRFAIEIGKSIAPGIGIHPVAYLESQVAGTGLFDVHGIDICVVACDDKVEFSNEAGVPFPKGSIDLSPGKPSGKFH